MNDFQAFFAQNAAIDTTEEIVVSSRFRDKDGQPIPWKIRSITEEENSELRKACMKRVPVKGGRTRNEFNNDLYVAKLAVAGVVYPNLKDAELQKSYGAMGAEDLLRKMLLPGEFSELMERSQALNGFEKDINELVDEVKN